MRRPSLRRPLVRRSLGEAGPVRRSLGEAGPVRRSLGEGGFTLIELLVVIAIIAILAAILFPVFARAKERARLVQCISNQKQLSVAILSYADDWDGTVPWWCVPPHWQVWDEGIYDYVKEKTIFTCPRNFHPRALRGRLIRSYALPRNVSGLGLGEIPSPARTVLLFEKGDQGFGVIADATGESFWQVYGTDEWTDPNDEHRDRWDRTYFHGGGKVLAFVDGHAKFFYCRDRDADHNPLWYNFPNNPEPDHPGYCGDAELGYGYTGHHDHNPGAHLPP